VRFGGAAKLVVVLTLLGCSTAPDPEAFGPPDASNMRHVASPQVGFVQGRVDAGSPCAQDFGTCPAELPEAGAPCVADPTLLCEYGSDQLVQCNAVASCAPDGGWSVSMAPDGEDSGCPTILPAGCPPSFAAGEDAGMECSSAGPVSCIYPEGSCFCESESYVATVDGSAVYVWLCGGPQSASCPSSRPRFGTACTEGEACSYTTVCDSYASSCVCGAWRQTLCPSIQAADNTLL
jgi:hypothetical protein